MGKRQKKNEKRVDIATLQPDELNALKKEVLEFVRQMESIDNEIDQLKQDRKELIEDAKEKLDVKTLKQVLSVLKIESGVAHKDCYDLMREALTDRSQ